MKTSVIRYRVADFLKQHPPFDQIPEGDLLELAGTGRVTFHESEEFLFRAGQKRDSLLRVIQQGRVEVIDERPAGERLRDLLGEGDILGLDRFFGGDLYANAARTASDVILYSIDAHSFEDLASKHPKVARYVAVNNRAGEKENRTWLQAESPQLELLQRRLQTGDPGMSIGEAAKRLDSSGSSSLALVDKEGRPLGLVTDREIRKSIGAVPFDAPCATIMDHGIETVSAELGIGEYFASMMRSRTRHLLITADGTAASPLKGVMRDTDLALASGRNPYLLMSEILDARSVWELDRLRRYRDALLSESLGGPETVGQCAPIASALDAAFVESIIRLAVEEGAAAGLAPPALPHCWLLFGRSARGESLAPECPSLGVVFADVPEKDDVAVTEYFSAISLTVQQHLAACGLRPNDENPPVRCLSLSGWKHSYTGLVRDPLGSEIYRVRSMFDFCPALGDYSLVRALEEFVAGELQVAEIFIPVLANDTLANLPPMTFFRGLVVELNGAERNDLDIERYALQPIEDAARVFALAAGRVSVTNTLDRLGCGAGKVFEEAREAFRITWFRCAAAGFRNPGSTVIDPSRLSKYDQRLLKTAFQSIRRLIELTSSTFIGATEL